MKTNHAILGIIGAATTGAILGLLFAPERGSETRKKLAKKTSEYTNDIKDKLTKIASTVSSIGDNRVAEVRNKYNEIIKDTSSQV